MSKCDENSTSCMTGFLEILQEEIHTWIYIQRRDRGLTMHRAWSELAEVLGVTQRQVQRYFTGDTPIPSDRIVPLCRFIGSSRLVHHLAFELNIECCDSPDADGLDTADIAQALVQTVERFGRQAAYLSQSFLKEPNQEDFRKIRASGRQARAHILHCEKLYEAMLRDRSAALEQKALRRKKARAERIRRSLEAKGQMPLFNGGDHDDHS